MLQTIMQFVTCYDSYPIKKGSSTLFWMPLPHIHFILCGVTAALKYQLIASIFTTPFSISTGRMLAADWRLRLLLMALYFSSRGAS